MAKKPRGVRDASTEATRTTPASDVFVTIAPEHAPLPPEPHRHFSVPFAIAFAALSFLLFLAVITAATAHHALGPLSGASRVGFWSLALAACAAAWAYRMSPAEGRPLRARVAANPDAWAYAGIVALFVVFLNAFVQGLFAPETWGLVSGHDQPQYFMQLHSFLFDFDLHYENEYALMPTIKEAMARWQPNDPYHNVAPIGSAILWMPFFLVAHVCVLMLHAVNPLFVANGASAPYAMAAAFGSNALAGFGMLMLYATLRRWVTARTAFCTILIMYLGTNLTWYLTDEVWMSHAPSFFTTCAVFYVWGRNRPLRQLRHWLLLGAAIGLAMLVRPSHFVLLIVPLAEALVQWRESTTKPMPLAKSAGATLGVLLLVFAPQLIVWSIRGTEGSPMAWGKPALVSILFSAQRGLIAWHPITILGVLGLPLLWRRCRSTMLVLALLLAAYWYTNAAIAAWSGGASFGMRRFVGVLPFLAPGIALAGSWMMHALRRHTWVVAIAAVAALGLYNHFLLVQHRGLWADPGAAVSWRTAWANSAALMQDHYGHPFSFPANWFFAWKHDATATQYDLLGTRLTDGSELDLRGQLLRAHLGEGWGTRRRDDYKEDSAFSAVEKQCSILLPLKEAQTYRVELEMAVPTELPHPQQATFSLNGESLAEVTMSDKGWNSIPLILPAQFTRNGLNTLTIQFTESKERPRPPGSLYIGSGLDMHTAPSWVASALLRRLHLTIATAPTPTQ